VGQRVEQDVDPAGVRIRREPEEVVGLLAFAFRATLATRRTAIIRISSKT
jgi:hypothetical protein